MSRIRIAVADDHAVVREGLRTLLAAQAGFEIVGEAGTTEEVLDCVRRARPEVLTLDLSMPGWGGSVIEPVKVLSPATKIVVYTMHDDAVYVKTAMAAGVLGYVLKSSATSTLLEAVRSAAAGTALIDPKLNMTTETKPAPRVDLSRREREVLELLVRGMTHQQIADQLFVSVKTVETYRARIREKTGLKTRAELTQYGLNAGMLSGSNIRNEPIS